MSDNTIEHPDHYLVLDTETTGLPCDPKAHVVEVGAALVPAPRPGWFERGEYSTFSTLVRPPVLTEEGLAIAKRVSGITKEQLDHARSPSEALHALEAWVYDYLCGGDRGGFYPKLDKTAVHAWNAPFDAQMMERTFSPCSHWSHVQLWGALPPDNCVMRRFTDRHGDRGMKRKDGSVRWFKLVNAASLMQLEWSGHAHRADADALMTLRLLVGMVQDTLEPRPARTFNPSTASFGTVGGQQ